LKVLEILNAYPGETFLQEHARALQSEAQGLELIWAFTQTNRTGKLSPPFVGGPRSYALPNFNRLGRVQKALFLLRYGGKRDLAIKESITTIIRKIKPDIIHFQFAATAIQLSWLATELNIPFTFSVRGTDVQVYPITVEGYKENLKIVSSRAFRVHAVCNDLKSKLHDITNCSVKINVIRTVINDDWAQIIREPKPGNILTVGRLTWAKGYSDLLLAMNVLQQRDIDFHLTIIGEGERRQELEYMIRNLKLGNKVRLVGKKNQDEIKKFLANTHLFVLSSLYEGFPNVLGEAMMAGVPVVSTDCNGVTEILSSDRGDICQVGNPDSLASSIQQALSAKMVVKDTALQNLARASFNQKKHASVFEKLWE
jgi:glycosyltransferase involved in cell wall biosynthesis